MKLSCVAAAAIICLVPGPAWAITITGAAQLTAALNAARGGEVFNLAPGNYGTLNIRNRAFASAITIRSADPSRPATFGRTQLNTVSGVNFSGVTFANPLSGATPLWTPAVQLYSSARINFSGVTVRGSMDGNAANDGHGIGVRGSTGISISNSTFTQLNRAITLNTSQGILVSGNTVSNVRSEGVNLAQVQNVRIIGNSFSNFHPVNGDHPDAIQAWTTGTNLPSANVVISGNLIVGSAGARMQGIFITDQTGNGALRYQGVVVTNNTLVGTSWHGITIEHADGIAITGNNVITMPDPKIDRSWIRVADATGIVNGNTAKQIVLGPGITSANNILNTTNATLADAAIAAWYAARKLPLPTQLAAKTGADTLDKVTATAFSIIIPTPDGDVPVNGMLFQSEPLRTTSIPDKSGTGFDQAGTLQRSLADGEAPVQDILLSAAPEPATWMQLLLGFGTLGWVVRRHRRRQAVVAG